MKKNIVIYGAGGHSGVIFDILNQSKKIKAIYLDDNISFKKNNNCKYILGKKKVEYFINKNKSLDYYLAIGLNNKKRLSKFNILNKKKIKLPKIVSKNSYVAFDTKIGDGTHILNFACIGHKTKIGKACIINNHSNIDHDCKIEDGVHIAPGAVLCGNVKVGKCTLIGANATILPNISVGENCIISAGAVIKKNVGANSVVR